MRRRSLLGGAAGLGLAATAGCLGLLETQPAGLPDVPADRPDAVYRPSHTEAMRTAGTREAGDWGVALTYSFPHRFWTVTGDRTTRVSVAGEDTLHMMLTLYDPETGRVVPVGSGVTATVEGPGGVAYDRAPWAMIAQRMSFHYGDNVVLPEAGTYTVTVETGTASLRRFGAFADRFGDGETLTVDLEYDPETVAGIEYEALSRAGSRGAVGLMDMGTVPTASLPPADGLGGALGGSGRAGSATVAAAYHEGGSRFGAEPYLALSPRTRYNRVPLPLGSLAATVTRDGEPVAELDPGTLRAGLDPTIGYHYGAPVPELAAGDEVTVRWVTPPQVARHEGYETAFLTASPATLSLG